MKSPFLKIWLYPILLAILTAAGLVMALVGSGIWHWFSWFALGIPLVACLRYGVFFKTIK